MVRSLVVILTFLISPRASSVKSSLDNAGLWSQPGLFRLSRSSKLETRDVLALETVREERSQRLSFVGGANSSFPTGLNQWSRLMCPTERKDSAEWLAERDLSFPERYAMQLDGSELVFFFPKIRSPHLRISIE